MVKVMESPCFFVVPFKNLMESRGFFLFFEANTQGVHIVFSGGDSLVPSPKR